MRGAGFPAPDWGVGAAPAAPQAPADNSCLRGWQRALETHLSHLDPASPALLLSQAGLHSGRALTALPTSAAVALPLAHLRRLRLPLPLTPRTWTCRCQGRLDPLGDHRSACATRTRWELAPMSDIVADSPSPRSPAMWCECALRAPPLPLFAVDCCLSFGLVHWDRAASDVGRKVRGKKRYLVCCRCEPRARQHILECRSYFQLLRARISSLHEQSHHK